MTDITHRPKNPGPARRWTRLALCVLAVLVFVFVVGPLLSEAPLVRTLTRFIDDHSIEASALFYTEVDEFSDADVHMRNARVHAPRGQDEKP
jgi:hypothetical protein